MGLYGVFYAAQLFLRLLSYAIFFYCILTWVAPRSKLCYGLYRFISPFCEPFRALSRKIMMRWGSPFDLTCWFVMIALQVLSYLLNYLYMFLVRLF